MKVEFKVKAKKYFEMDADRLEECKETDYCTVILDIKNKHAEYCWIPEKGNPGNYPYEYDFYNGVLELWNEVKNTDQVWDVKISE